jgi:hypothetical protein
MRTVVFTLLEPYTPSLCCGEELATVYQLIQYDSADIRLTENVGPRLRSLAQFSLRSVDYYTLPKHFVLGRRKERRKLKAS